MGQIFVNGVGKVNIEGDTPTAEEEKAIVGQYNKNKEELDSLRAELAVEQGFDRKKAARLGLEIGGSIAAVWASGGFALPAVAARWGMFSLPFVRALATSSGASALGGGSGAALSNTFDPSKDIVKDIARAAAEGGVAELIGAPAMIKIGGLLSKIKKTPKGEEYLSSPITNNETPKGFIRAFENADKTEIWLQKTADEVLKDPTKYATPLTPVNQVIKYADEVKKGMTTAMKTDNRFVDSMDQVVKGSLLGGDKVIEREQAFNFMTKQAVKKFTEDLSKGTRTDIGDAFFDALTKAEGAKRAFFKEAYDSVERLALEKSPLTRTIDAIDSAGNPIKQQVKQLPKTIPMKNIVTQLKNFMKEKEFTDATTRKILTDLETRYAPTKGPNKGQSILASLKGLNTFKKEVTAKVMDPTVQGTEREVYQFLKDYIQGGVKNGKPYGMLGNENFLKQHLDKEVVDRLLAVDDAYRLYNKEKLLEDGILAEILKKGNKDGGVDMIFQAMVKDGKKERLVETVVNKINALTEPRVIKGFTPTESGQFLTKQEATNLIDSMRGQFSKELLDGATNKEGVLDLQKLINDMDAKKGVRDLLVKKDIQQQMNKLIKKAALGFNTMQATGLPGRMAIQMKQAGAAGNLLQFGGAALGFAGFGAASTPAVIGGATLFLAPYVMGKIMTNKALNKFFFERTLAPYTIGSLSKYKIQDGGASFRQIVTRLLDEGLVSEEDAKKAIDDSKTAESEMLAAGIKTNKDFSNLFKNKKGTTGTPQQTIKPSPTTLSSAQPSITQSASIPSAPVTTTTTAPVQRTRGQTYRGLFPFDVTGGAAAGE